jgi:hypothetical protein
MQQELLVPEGVQAAQVCQTVATKLQSLEQILAEALTWFRLEGHLLSLVGKKRETSR